MSALTPFQLPLNRLPDQVGAAFRPALGFPQGGINAGQRPLGESGGGLLVVDLFPAHTPKIDDITKCYKARFCRYHLLTTHGYLISSTPSERETDMTAEAKKQKILASIASRGWFTAEIYFQEARQLEDDGAIKMGERFSVGGNRKSVWVAA